MQITSFDKIFYISDIFLQKRDTMTKLELDKLKEKLPWGFAESISEKTEYSVPYIYQVLNGKRNCLKIISAANDLAREAMQEEIQLQRAIAEL